MSYGGLTGALRASAGAAKARALSKQRNRHLQSVLIEAGKSSLILNESLKGAHVKAKEKGGDSNRVTREVAGKLVAYFLAADRAFLAIQGRPLPPEGLRFLRSRLAYAAKALMPPLLVYRFTKT